MKHHPAIHNVAPLPRYSTSSKGMQQPASEGIDSASMAASHCGIGVMGWQHLQALTEQRAAEVWLQLAAELGASREDLSGARGAALAAQGLQSHQQQQHDHHQVRPWGWRCRCNSSRTSWRVNACAVSKMRQ
jgi:hypothetical protein